MPLHVVLLIVALIASAAPGATQPPAPRIACDSPVYDYGAVDNRQTVEHTFLLRNDGTLPLVITEVRAGCGCTTTALSTNTISPGHTARLTARLSLQGIMGPKPSSIYLHSNDPQNPVFACQFTGTALAELEVSPARISTVILPGGDEVDQRISIVNRTGQPLHLTGIRTADFFTAEAVTNENGIAYSLIVRLVPGLKAPGADGTLVVTTDHARYARLEIPVSVAVSSEIIALPSAVNLDPSASAARQARYVVLRSTRGAPFNVTKIVSEPPDLPAAIQSGKPTWVRLRVGPAGGSGWTGGVLRISTDSSNTPEILVPVTIGPDGP